MISLRKSFLLLIILSVNVKVISKNIGLLSDQGGSAKINDNSECNAEFVNTAFTSPAILASDNILLVRSGATVVGDIFQAGNVTERRELIPMNLTYASGYSFGFGSFFLGLRMNPTDLLIIVSGQPWENKLKDHPISPNEMKKICDEAREMYYVNLWRNIEEMYECRGTLKKLKCMDGEIIQSDVLMDKNITELSEFIFPKTVQGIDSSKSVSCGNSLNASIICITVSLLLILSS